MSRIKKANHDCKPLWINYSYDAHNYFILRFFFHIYICKNYLCDFSSKYNSDIIRNHLNKQKSIRFFWIKTLNMYEQPYTNL